MTSHHKMKSISQVILTLLFLPLIVSGCSTSSETFDCEPGKGVGCQSITKVNKMIDAGHFIDSKDEFFSSLFVKPPVLSHFPPAINRGLADPTRVDHQVMDNTSMQFTVVRRIPEQPIRVWVAPYQDEVGNFHEASVVHSVIQGGYWQVQNPDGKV